jgi:hypothetical protein
MIWFVLKTMFLAHAQIRLDIIFKSNKLSLNLEKTKFIVFKSRQNKYNYTFQIIINNEYIEQVKETVFLGYCMRNYLGNHTFRM